MGELRGFKVELLVWSAQTVEQRSYGFKDYYIFKKICQGTLYEFSFLQVELCATIPMGPRTPYFASCSMCYSL